MRVVSIAMAMLFAGVAPQFAGAQTPPPIDLVRQAITAMGGEQALRGLKGLTLEAEARHWEPEQSFTVDREPRLLGDSKLTITWNIEKGQARTDWVRTMYYPFPAPEKYSEIVTPAAGYIITEKFARPMSKIRFASFMREIERVSSTLLIKALDAPRDVGALPDQPLGEQNLPAVAFTRDGTRFTILFDRKTHLPAAVRTLDDDFIYGDANYDVILANWKPVGGIQMAHSHTYRLNNIDIGRVTYKDITANPTLSPQTFEIRGELRAASSTSTPARVPYQWVIRRINLARFLDSDAVNYDSATSRGLKLVEVAPNIQHATGGTHNSLIVAMKDYLVVFDAPINEWQSRWTIDAAKAKYPGKPVKYLVLTHHHYDHTGGARTYVAEGASVIVGAPNKAHFEKVFRAPHTVNPDELQKNPKPATVVEVAERMSLKDENGEILLYKIANQHADGMLIGYIVNAGVVWVTDLWSPVRDKRKGPGIVAMSEAIRKIGITPARYAGGHGGVASQADLETILAQ